MTKSHGLVPVEIRTYVTCRYLTEELLAVNQTGRR